MKAIHVDGYKLQIESTEFAIQVVDANSGEWIANIPKSLLVSTKAARKASACWNDWCEAMARRGISIRKTPWLQRADVMRMSWNNRPVSRPQRRSKQEKRSSWKQCCNRLATAHRHAVQSLGQSPWIQWADSARSSGLKRIRLREERSAQHRSCDSLRSRSTNAPCLEWN